MPSTNRNPNQDTLRSLNASGSQVVPSTEQLDSYAKRIRSLVTEMKKAGVSVQQIEMQVSKTAEEFLESWIKKQEEALSQAKKRRRETKEEVRDLKTLLTLQSSSKRELSTLQSQIKALSKDASEANKEALVDLRAQAKDLRKVLKGIDISKVVSKSISLEGPTKALQKFSEAVKTAMLEPYAAQKDAQEKAVNAAQETLDQLQEAKSSTIEKLNTARAIGDVSTITQLTKDLESLQENIDKQRAEVSTQRDTLAGVTQIYDQQSSKIEDYELTEDDLKKFGLGGDSLETLTDLLQLQHSQREKEARKDSRSVQKQLIELKKATISNKKDELLKQRREGTIDYRTYRDSIKELNETLKDLNKTEKDLLEEEEKDEKGPEKTTFEKIEDLFDPKHLKEIFLSASKASFEEAEKVLNRWQGTINTRLEGSGRTYQSVTDNIGASLMFSGLVKQQDVVSNLGELVKSGIAYNVEQRAFLKTVADDIDSTFNAFDANLLRLVRLQREDSSYARMGLETTLNRLLNQEFLDSSYMSDMYDNIQGALIEVSSQLTTEESARFDYTINKWLGAMYSMGAGSGFIQSIASGLNMLGTGNVQGLAGSPMQTLLAQASNRAGLDYAKLLTEGLDSSNANELMKAMVEYLAEIADANKDNRVVAGAYSSIYGMTIADMTAVRNLAGDISSTYADAISNIYNSSLTYEQMAGVTEARLSTLAENYSVGRRIETLFSNILYSTVDDIVQSPAAYMTYKAADFLQGQGIDPTINLGFLGSGVSFKALDTVKLGIMGISLLGNALGALGKASSGTSLTQWIDEGEMRGNAYDLSAKSAVSSSIVANASSEDAETKSLKEGAASAKKKQKTVQGKEEDEEELDTDALFYGLFAQNNKEGALSAVNVSNAAILQLLNDQATEDKKAHRVTIVGFDMGDTDMEIPVKLGSVGTTQADERMISFLQYLKGSDSATIQYIIDILEATLAENDSFNVNVLSADMEVVDWLKGKGGSQFTATAERPEFGTGGTTARTMPQNNGLTSPGTSKSVGRPINYIL